MLSMSSTKMTQDVRTPKSRSPRIDEFKEASSAGCRWWRLQVLEVERNIHKGAPLELLKSIATPACFTVIFILVITLFVHHTSRSSETGVYRSLPPLPQMINNLLSARDPAAEQSFTLTDQPVRDEKAGKRHEARKRQESNDQQTGVEELVDTLRPPVAKTTLGVFMDTDLPQSTSRPPSNELSESLLNLSEITSPSPGSVEQPRPLSSDTRDLLHQISPETLNSLSMSPGPSAAGLDSRGLVPGLKDVRLRPAPADRAAWVEFPYATVNETEHIMLQIRQNGTLPCHNVSTQTANVLGLGFPQPDHHEKGPFPIIRLAAVPVHDITIVSLGADGCPRCAGGDFYETDLSGPRWKSRPPVFDHNDGTYSVRLQLDQRFAMDQIYNFTVTLLFTNFNSLRLHPRAWARMKEVATYQIEFFELTPSTTKPGSKSEGFLSPAPTGGANPESEFSTTGSLPLQLSICGLGDFNKKYWSGRWTREHATQDCEYDKYGRWKCVDTNLECQIPWCSGKVGRLESNGWVYSAHCAFKLFELSEAWECLDGKWLFFWGDSNHIDTIRNLLNFVLGFEHRFRFLDRRMDKTYASPLDAGASVRITSMFNGHSNVTKSYEGLHSLHDPKFAAQLRSFFTGDTAPDVMIMNSGLHDGMYWRDVEGFLKDGVDFAADFWADVWSKMKVRSPDVLYRTTVSTGGRARKEAFNPHKMEVFNHLMLDRFVRMKLDRFHIIDGFDYTFPWHYDHKTNDGVHYGRPPMLSKWAGGNIGHRYFVDLMLVHMLLNAICPIGSS